MWVKLMRQVGVVTGACGALYNYGALSSWCDSSPSTTSWDWNWDRMAEVSKARELREKEAQKKPNQESKNQVSEKSNPANTSSKKKRHPTRYLFLIRHGQYHYVSKRGFPGGCITEAERQSWDSANKLTDLGESQAKITGTRLADIAESGGFRFDALYYSDQKRAKQTAEIIHSQLVAKMPELPAHVDPLLREGDPIEPEPKHSTYKPSARSCYEDGARIEAAFRRYVHRPPLEQESDSFEILVCHGNVIRYFVCRALQLDPAAWLRLSLYNCSVTTLRISSSGTVSVSGLGDTGHFPADMVTYS